MSAGLPESQKAYLRMRKHVIDVLGAYSMEYHLVRKWPDMRSHRRYSKEADAVIIHGPELVTPVDESVPHALKNNGIDFDIKRNNDFFKSAKNGIVYVLVPVDQAACP